jgi:Uncharacterized membrane protein, possible Na+ channel or pump
MIGIGTLLNAGAIIAGSIAGVMIHSRLPQKMVNTIFQGMGLITIVIGISMALQSNNLVIIVLSIVLGIVIGEWIDIDKYTRRLSDYLIEKGRARFGKENVIADNVTGDGDDYATENGKDSTTGSIAQMGRSASADRFTQGFVTASMLFCVGSMAILGAIEDGMGREPNLLITKSVMDGISSIAFAATFGFAVLFSAFPVLIYQGLLTIFAAFIMQFMNDTIIADLTAVGGMLLIGLGINIMKIREVNVINMLPALVFVVILSYLFGS